APPAFLGTGSLLADFLPDVFLASPADFSTAALAADFFAAGFLEAAVFFFGALAALADSKGRATSKVRSSGTTPLGRVAFILPHLTYGPKRPAMTCTGASSSG